MRRRALYAITLTDRLLVCRVFLEAEEPVPVWPTEAEVSAAVTRVMRRPVSMRVVGEGLYHEDPTRRGAT